MKQLRKTTLALSVSAALFMAAAAPIGAQTDLTIENDGLTLTAGAVSSEQILSIKLRINGPGDFSYEERLEDSLIQWVPDEELADGWYTWETLVVTVEPGAPMLDVSPPTPKAAARPESRAMEQTARDANALEAKAPAAPIPAERFFTDEYKDVHKRSGRFRVQDGLIVPAPVDGDELSDASEPGVFGTIAGAIFDFVLSSAHAADCAAPCIVTGTSESEIQLISDNNSTSGGPWDWEIEASFNDGQLRIGNLGGGSEPVKVDYTAPADALHIDDTGNIGLGTSTPATKLELQTNAPIITFDDTDDAQNWGLLAGGGGFRVADNTAGTIPFLIETGTGHVGIGTSAPDNDLTIASTSPTIRFVDVSGSADWELNGNPQSTIFDIADVTGGTSPFVIEAGAPNSTLWLESSGEVGIGTNNPQDKLHIRATNGTAGILLEETSAIATNTMLEMQHNGNPGFQMENTSSGAIWQFRLGGSGGSEQFTVNKVGTGSPEASFIQNGNLVIRGSLIEGSSREIKQDIAPVNADDLMARLEALDVHEWSYTSSPGNRHIGPMAEDFYELFGFGKDDKSIFPRDLAGIALAAAKEVHQRNRALEAQNAELLDRLERIEAQLEMN